MCLVGILWLIDIQPYAAKYVLSSRLMCRHSWNRKDRLTESPQVHFQENDLNARDRKLRAARVAGEGIMPA